MRINIYESKFSGKRKGENNVNIKVNKDKIDIKKKGK